MATLAKMNAAVKKAAEAWAAEFARTKDEQRAEAATVDVLYAELGEDGREVVQEAMWLVYERRYLDGRGAP